MENFDCTQFITFDLYEKSNEIFDIISELFSSVGFKVLIMKKYEKLKNITLVITWKHIL